MKKVRNTTPQEIHEGLLRLRKLIKSNAEFVFVSIEVDVESTPQECYGNVEKKISKDGGSIVYGWSIWEVEGVMVEGEHHAVWCAPNGNLVCVSRRRDGDNRMLFLPDSVNLYSGIPIGSVRMSWPKNRHVEKWIDALNERDRFISRHTSRGTGLLQCNADEHHYHMHRVHSAGANIIQKLGIVITV